MITSASGGRAWPGRSQVKSTAGSIRSGSASSKLAIRDSIGAAIRSFPPRPPWPRSSTTASSAGSFAAQGSQGIRPKPRHPVRDSMAAMPASNNFGSPRNLLTTKPRISSASARSSTAWVPTTLAMTPPRSISPISTTGTPARRANPMLAMSPWRRLISAGLPAPSTMINSNDSARRLKLASTSSMSAPRLDVKSAARSLWRGLPWTMTWAPRSLSGLSRTGLKSTWGASPAAWACSAWARPISPPAQAAALFDMFCGLNGATRSPRRSAMRHSAATITDLPTSEPVPWSISARALMNRPAWIAAAEMD